MVLYVLQVTAAASILLGHGAWKHSQKQPLNLAVVPCDLVTPCSLPFLANFVIRET